MQRHLRLRRRADFIRLRRHGRVWRHAFLILSVAPNGLPYNRYGFITSKHLGKAVVRNRTRRLLREAVRGVHAHLQPGHDIVFIARPAIVGQPFQAVREAVTASLKRAKLWLPPPEDGSP